MNEQQILSQKVSELNITQAGLAAFVAAYSNRGEWYSGKSSTNVSDWIAEGDISPETTLAELIAEWDE